MKKLSRENYTISAHQRPTVIYLNNPDLHRHNKNYPCPIIEDKEIC